MLGDNDYFSPDNLERRRLKREQMLEEALKPFAAYVSTADGTEMAEDALPRRPQHGERSGSKQRGAKQGVDDWGGGKCGGIEQGGGKRGGGERGKRGRSQHQRRSNESPRLRRSPRHSPVNRASGDHATGHRTRASRSPSPSHRQQMLPPGGHKHCEHDTRGRHPSGSHASRDPSADPADGRYVRARPRAGGGRQPHEPRQGNARSSRANLKPSSPIDEGIGALLEAAFGEPEGSGRGGVLAQERLVSPAPRPAARHDGGHPSASYSVPQSRHRPHANTRRPRPEPSRPPRPTRTPGDVAASRYIDSLAEESDPFMLSC